MRGGGETPRERANKRGDAGDEVKSHNYEVQIDWTGNDGHGTETYRAYRRDHSIVVAGKPQILGSSDPSFRGDPARYNPEEFLVAALSACHMLSYLHLCATNKISVLDYHDAAHGTMEETADGSGRFIRVELRPKVKISANSDKAKAIALHAEAHHKCFIANSVNFPVEVTPGAVETA
jgi:organic hydroperoxide reductase OsmC/OhrA